MRTVHKDRLQSSSKFENQEKWKQGLRRMVAKTNNKTVTYWKLISIDNHLLENASYSVSPT